MANNIIYFKGIKFYNYSFQKIYKIIKKGGYLVAPAASALYNLEKKKSYYNSLKNSDIAILDSGFFCVLLRIFEGKSVKKLSGYLFLKKFIKINQYTNHKFLLVDPTKIDSILNKKLLNKNKIFNVESYVAPKYTSIKDMKLLNIIKRYKPKFIIINLGGEVQELLALYLKKNINFKISIICTGAAIAFITKRQAPINDLIDKFYLGWVYRLLFNPKVHFFRTIKSLLLIKHFLYK